MKQGVPIVYIIPKTERGHRALRAMRHRHVQGLLPRRVWWQQFDWPVYALCIGIIALVAIGAGALAALAYAARFGGSP